MMRKQILLLITALVLSIGLCGAVSAFDGDVIYVNGSSGDDANNGFTPDTAKLTIGNATGTVNYNGVVNIADGTYTGDGNTGITISKNMYIIGQSQNSTIIDAENNDWIFFIEDGLNLYLSNLTLKNSKTFDDDYGAIDNEGSLLICTDCSFTGNTALHYGGAIHNYRGVVTCTNCNFTDNSAVDEGGAIYNEMGEVTCTNCNFTENSAHDGGAIYNGDEGTLTCTSCDFTENIASDAGGAIANMYNQLTCTDCTFTKNEAAYYGGAIYNYEAVMTCTNCDFTENRAYSEGGAIYSEEESVATCTNCDFIKNTAHYNGGAICNYYTELTCTSCNFTENSAEDQGGVLYSAYSDGNSITFNFNRIVNNTADEANNIYDGNSDSEDILNALYNWWGSNDGPADGSIVGELVEYDPWLVMTYSADPTTIQQGSTSTLTADFRYDSKGTFHEPSLGHLPDGTPVTFTTTLGNVGSKSVVTYTLNGVAIATLRGDEAAGEASTTATLDDQTLTTPVTIRAAGGDDGSTVTAEAATTETVGMQTTGAPLAGMVLAILIVLGGFIGTRKN